jgi:phage terminase Nu1 subunit (DNA packaging protein)
MDVPLRQDEPDVERLEAEVRHLVGERQRLRAADANPTELERNRSRLVRTQLEFSRALIRRHLTVAASL